MTFAWTFRLCLLSVCFALANANDRHSNFQDIIRQYIQQALQSQSTGNNRFVDPALAAIYCAYCRQRGWTNCINRFCFQRRIIPPSFSRNIVSPTRSFGLRGNNANVQGRHSNLQGIILRYIQQILQSQSTGNNRFGPELAAINCALCRQLNYWECIKLFCYRRRIIPPRFPGNIVSPTRSFGFQGNNAITAGGFGFRRRQETSGSSKRLRMQASIYGPRTHLPNTNNK